MEDFEQIRGALHNPRAAGDGAGAARFAELAKGASGAPPAAPQRSWLITAPNGKRYKVTGDNEQGALAALKKMLSAHNVAAPAAGEFVEVTTPEGRTVRLPKGMSRSEMADALNRLPDELSGGAGSALRGAPKVGDTSPGEGPETADFAQQLAELSHNFQDAIKPQSRPVHAALAGATQGVTFGMGDELAARILSVHPTIDYEDALPFVRRDFSFAERNNPKAFMAGEIGGSVVGLGKLGAASKAAGFTNAAASTGGRIARGALTGAAGGALAGFGEGAGSFAGRAESAAQGAALGAVAGGALGAIGEGFTRAARAISGRGKYLEDIPSVEGLKDTAQRLYDTAKASGAIVPKLKMQELSVRAAHAVKSEGFDQDLHPRVAAVLKRLASERGPKSFGEMDLLRRVATNAAASQQPDERRIALKVVDLIDDTIDRMGEGSADLKAAREIWGRMRRVETIEALIEKASLQDDFAAGLRSQFKTLLRNPKAMRGFKASEIEAIRAVATGSAVRKGLRVLGKALSPSSLQGVSLTGAAAIGGAGMGAVALPVAGIAAKSTSDAMTRNAATAARDAIALGYRPSLSRNALADFAPLSGVTAARYPEGD